MSTFDAVRRPGAAAAAPGAARPSLPSAAPATAVRVLAAAALAANIAIHVYLAPDHLKEMPYIGVSFVIAAILLTGVLIGLVFQPRESWPWLTGAALSLGMAVLFVVSRTFGLPDYHEAWTSDSALGLWCLVPEAIFLACAATVLPAIRRWDGL